MSILLYDPRILSFGSVVEIMNREGKKREIYGEGKYIFFAEEKKNIFLSEKKNGEGKYFWRRRRKTKKEKEENIWGRKIHVLQRIGKAVKEKEEIFGEGKLLGKRGSRRKRKIQGIGRYPMGPTKKQKSHLKYELSPTPPLDPCSLVLDR